MTQTQQNRLSMYKAVADHLNSNPDLWKKFAPFAAAAAGLQQVIAGMDNALLQQKTANSTGVTADKDHLIGKAIQQVLALARNGAAYALAGNHMALYAQLDYSRTYVERLPDNEQVALLQSMLDQLTAKGKPPGGVAF